jgi:predicted phosphodiesterase
LSSTPTTPVILPADIRFYLSGGYFNTEPINSLGGEISSFQLVSGTLNGLFDRVDTAEAEIGDTEYRCIYLRNTSQTRKLLATRIWIETGTASADTSIAISIGSSGINGTEPIIPDEGVAPPMNFFEIPLSEPSEPNIGDLYAGDHVALWVRWYVNTGTTSIADDFAVLRIDGDREPETVSQPLPDPTDPPPTTGCPQGSKWSPVEFRCVDDSTVIICPNGYTYNSTTQRCVPPTTPPPTMTNWTFAAVGDFSCTSDADDTGALIGSKLNKTAGADIGLLLALGDFSYEDGDQSCWLENMESSLGPTIYPDHVAPIIGNHDDTEDGAASDRTDIINEFPLIPTSGYYAFTRRNIRFIMMDTQVSYSTSSQQYAFVKTELEAATANPSIMWKVVCYHKPSFTSATDYGPLTDFRSAYHPLFDTHKVNLIFNGHNHNYGRSKPVRYNASSPDSPIIASDLTTNANYINIDGRVFITVGTGGRSSHPEFDGSIENFMAFRHEPEPYGSIFVTLEDSGNRLHVQFITNANQILDDFTLSKPGATPPPTGEAVCPQGFHFDSNLGRCVISPQQCPTNYRWEPAQNRCVAISGEPPPPPGPVDPMAGVVWLYDATTTLNTPQTINAGSYDSVAGIILSSGHGSITSTTISGGWLTLPGAGAATPTANAYTHLGIDYWKLSQYATDDRLGKNTAVTFTFRYNGNTSISVRDGNSYRTGVLSPAMIFEGFACDFVGPNPTVNNILDCTSARVIYWYDPSVPTSFQSETIRAQYPGGRSLTEGQDYKIFITYKTNRVTNIVVTNAWLDFGDGDGWIKVITDQIYSASNWLPGSVPSGYDDTDEINSGPTAIRRHRISIVNWNTTIDHPRPSLMIKDIKVGTTPYLSDVNNPPPPTGGGGGGTGTGGVLDSRGIKWYFATGQQGVISQSRDEASDDRWSGNVSGLGQYGYECTMIMQNFSGTSGEAHFAMKHGGPNHSGDCDHTEGGSCCCWYDTGIRENGDIQLQIERPHPNNDDFDLPSSQLFINNIGKGMAGNDIGLKWLWHPVTPGGDADNGGILLMMWVDTDPIGTDGKPTNNWRLVYKFTDTGQILGDYPPPDEHDLEIRNSDTSDRDVFGGGLHWRKIQANDTLQWGTAPPPSGGGTTTPPPPPPPSGTAFKLISWGDNDTTQDAEEVLDIIMTESSVEQYLFAGDGPYSEDSTEWISMMSSHFNTNVLKNKLMLAQGNHEHPESESQTSENQIEAWFPGLHNANEGLEWLQAKQVRNCYIIVMNSQDPNIDQVGGAQYNWVQARLNDAVALRTAGTIDWIIMMVHKNWFSVNAFTTDGLDARFAYKTMCNNAQVDFMFSGHTHTYQIFKPIVSRVDENDETDNGTLLSGTLSGSNWNFALTHGIMQIVNGNGGHEINGFSGDPDSISTVLYANDTEFGYTVLEIDGKTARVIAKSVGGNVRHTVTVVR